MATKRKTKPKSLREQAEAAIVRGEGLGAFGVDQAHQLGGSAPGADAPLEPLPRHEGVVYDVPTLADAAHKAA